MKYKSRAATERDLDEAASWYRENATDPRTPLRFLVEVRATCASGLLSLLSRLLRVQGSSSAKK